MKLRIKHVLAAGTLRWPSVLPKAVKWTEVLVTIGDINTVAMENDRQFMTYFATVGIALIAGDKMAPGGPIECAGMIDTASNGMM